MERGGEYSGRKWTLLVVIVLIQAFSGMNSDFSSYSLKLKSVLGLSQVQLSYLSMASDFGKLFGWCPGLFLVNDEEWFPLLSFAFLGSIDYVVQWLLINSIMSLPYFPVFVLCLLSSYCNTWINMVSYVLCIRHFPLNRSLALSLGISFNGMSAAIYTLIAKAINPDDSSLYLVLNGVAPLIISIIALAPILSQPPAALNIRRPPDLDNTWTFLWFYIAAAFIGSCLLFFNSMSLYALEVTVFLVPVMTLMILIFKMSCNFYDDPWTRRAPPSIPIEDYLETNPTRERRSCCGGLFIKDRLTRLGEPHSFKLLLRRWDFWLYYTAYFCSGTIGLVYSNSLGQIAQSLGFSSDISSLVFIYSACSFVGRLLAAVPDFLQHMVNHARTGWLSFAVCLTPGGLLLLVLFGSKTTLQVATALIGLSSGFVFSAAASLTWELFGLNNAGINHGILITNVPLGSFLYGRMAAFFHEANIDNSKFCIGKKCYDRTLACWFFISFILGVGSSTMLYWRTRSAYHRLR